MSKPQPDRPTQSCANCKFFHRNDTQIKVQQDNQTIAVWGACRRYAPKDGELNPVTQPLIIRYPENSLGYEAAGNLHEYMQTAFNDVDRQITVTLPGSRDSFGQYEWQISSCSARAKSPTDWCGDWEPNGPGSHALIIADWLEERGHGEAAKDLRSFNEH